MLKTAIRFLLIAGLVGSTLSAGTTPLASEPRIDGRQLPAFQATLDKLRSEQEVPGISISISREGRNLFAGGSGFADLETERPMTADTALYAGSLTKVFTAVLVLSLVEEGKLSLETGVGGIATQSTRLGDGVNVTHLLTHASGLGREGNFGYWFSADFPTAPALERYVASAELRTVPGADFHYSNIGYATLGGVIERASGQQYDAALRSRVLAPLKMSSSGSPGPVTNIAVGYSPVNRVIPSETRPFAGLGKRVGARRIREYHNAKAMTPAFGAYTSALDLGRFAQFLLGYADNPVLSAEMRQKMLSAQRSGWGLGIKLDRHRGRRVARHSGWFAAHRSHLLLDLDSAISVVVLTNSDGASPGIIAEALLEETLGANMPLGVGIQ